MYIPLLKLKSHLPSSAQNHCTFFPTSNCQPFRRCISSSPPHKPPFFSPFHFPIPWKPSKCPRKASRGIERCPPNEKFLSHLLGLETRRPFSLSACFPLFIGLRRLGDIFGARLSAPAPTPRSRANFCPHIIFFGPGMH